MFSVHFNAQAPFELNVKLDFLSTSFFNIVIGNQCKGEGKVKDGGSMGISTLTSNLNVS